MTSYAQTLSISRQMVVSRRGEPRRRTGSWVHLLAPTILFFALLTQLWFRVAIIETGYKQEALREEALKKDAQIRQLRLDLAYLSRPTKLAPEIEKKLGLQRLAPGAVRNTQITQGANSK